MHAIGNDFVIMDQRNTVYDFLNTSQYQQIIQKITNRRTGVGCDQLLIMQRSSTADCYMSIYNADGDEAEMCINGARCVAHLLITTHNKTRVNIATKCMTLQAWLKNHDSITISLNKVSTSYSNEYHYLSLPEFKLQNPSYVNVSNKHLVFFRQLSSNTHVFNSLPLQEVVKQLYARYEFTKEYNISIAEVIDKRSLTVRVWERGVGETMGCGSAAYAVFITALKKELIIQNNVEINFTGGTLRLALNNKEILLSGNVCYVFKGNLYSEVIHNI